MTIPTLVDHCTYLEVFDKIIESADDGIVIVEIGVFVGGSVCYLSQKLKEKNIDYKIIAIDNFKFSNISPQDNEKYAHNLQPYIAYSNNIRKFQANVITIVGDSIEISQLFKDNTIDFLYIDGDHSEYCIKELKNWLPKMKENSLIAGHDYDGSIHVRKACKKYLGIFHTTSNNASYYKQIGDGIVGKRKIITPKVKARIFLYLYSWYKWFMELVGR